MNLFRRLPTSRLLALCAAVTAFALAIVAVAGAVGDDPQAPPAKPLAEAIHTALDAPPVEGISARVELTNGLVDANGFEGISPLVSGGEGRLWMTKDAFRLELQGNSGDVQVVVRDREFWAYDGASDQAWRGKLPAEKAAEHGTEKHGVPSVAEIQRKLDRVMRRVAVAGPQPGVEAGQPSYSVRLSPRKSAGLLGGVGLAWDAVRGTPLRAAVYAKGRSAPVLELKATQVEYGPVGSDVFAIAPPPGADVTDLGTAEHGQGQAHGRRADKGSAAQRPKLGDVGFDVVAPATLAGRKRTAVRPARFGDQAGAVVVYGRGLDAIVVVERPYVAKPPVKQTGHHGGGQVELPTTDVNGAQARVLDTPLGSAVEWTRDGVTLAVAGSAPRSVVEAAAREL